MGSWQAELEERKNQANKLLKDSIATLRDITITNRFAIAEQAIIAIDNLGMYHQGDFLRSHYKRIQSERPIRTLAYIIRDNLKPFCGSIAVAGSIRRKVYDPKDIDIVLAPLDNQLPRIIEVMKGYRTTEAGEKEFGFALPFKNEYGFPVGEYKIDIFACSYRQFPAMLLCRTGSRNFNIKCRGIAKAKGLLLNQYGLSDRETEIEIPCFSEADILKAIGMEYVEPQLRSL